MPVGFRAITRAPGVPGALPARRSSWAPSRGSETFDNRRKHPNTSANSGQPERSGTLSVSQMS
eukprot:3638004-Pyramimonas_sp.AAC.1